MQYRVLRPADIQINRHPVFFLRAVTAAIIVIRVNIPQIIPAAPRPLRHSIGLAGRAVGQMHPFGRARQRRLARGGRFEIRQWRRQQRQSRFRQRLVPARLPNDGKRLPPITLPAEEPVAQFVVDCFAS